MDERDVRPGSERYRALLEFGLQRWVQGREPLRESLLARAAGDVELVERVLSDLTAYHRARSRLGGDAATPRLAIGERVGDFEIVGWIAVGGMGEVYRARQLSLGGRLVALKLLRVDARDSKAWKRFDREARILASLHHPHLATAYGAFEFDGSRCLAMQLVDGPTLGEVRDELAATPELVRRPAVRRRIVERIVEVASALDVVHRSGLVHRDVKPENIVLAGGWTSDDPVPDAPAVLVDFGLARPICETAESRTGGTPATPNYAPPEQLLGDPLDARADVFSLGVTLHDLLSARRPSERERAAHGLEALRTLVDDVDRDLDAVLARATDPDPKWRHADAGELASDLRAWLAGAAPPSLRSGPFGRLARWWRASPRRAARWVAVGAASFGVLAIGVHWGRSRQHVVQAAEAFERGDWAAADELASNLPPWTLSLSSRDDAFARFARRAAARAPSDPLIAVLDELRAGRRWAALRVAATRLAEHGVASDAELLDVLDAALRCAADDERRVEAATTLARLFYERPVSCDDDASAVARILPTLRSRCSEPTASERERLWCLSAVSGVARPGDVPWLLDIGLAAGDGTERRRLALLAVERVLRRALASEREHEVDLASILERLRKEFLEVSAALACGDPRASSSSRPCDELARTLAFVARARGEAEQLRAWLSDVGWWDSAEFQYHAHELRPLRAALHDTAVLPELVDPSVWSPLHAHLECWAACLGTWGDDELTHAVRELVEVDARELFDSHAAAAAALRRGRDPAADLDPDTLLVAARPPAEAEWAVIESVRSKATAPPAVPASVDDPDAEFIAGWNFHDELRSELAAGATGVRGRRVGVAADTSHASFLRFGDFGGSEVHLEFDARALARPFDLVLVLRHQIGVRPYYPYGGRVVLDARIDENSIAGELEVSAASYTEIAHVIGWDRLVVDGRHGTIVSHRLAIRLHEKSTTTYRLQEVELWQRTRP
ncbi:MAG: serine/threonine protein kinase [Planctomycetes bacterium]|nr:serine/threonine protein kinase [Planctomycetota bacterium]